MLYTTVWESGKVQPRTVEVHMVISHFLVVRGYRGGKEEEGRGGTCVSGANEILEELPRLLQKDNNEAGCRMFVKFVHHKGRCQVAHGMSDLDLIKNVTFTVIASTIGSKDPAVTVAVRIIVDLLTAKKW